LTGAQVEGAAIPEVVPVEGVVPEAEVTTRAASEPVETASPGVTEEVRDDALSEISMGVVVRSPEIKDADVVWTSLGPLPWWVPGPTTRWAPGLPGLRYTTPDGVEHKDYEEKYSVRKLCMSCTVWKTPRRTRLVLSPYSDL
jgi:hypothetical protein